MTARDEGPKRKHNTAPSICVPPWAGGVAPHPGIGALMRSLCLLPGGLGRFVSCSIGANHSRLRHLGWEKCGHGLTSRPRESASEFFLDEFLGLFRYLLGSGRALLAGVRRVHWVSGSGPGRKRVRLNRKTPAHLAGFIDAFSSTCLEEVASCGVFSVFPFLITGLEAWIIPWVFVQVHVLLRFAGLFSGN